MPEDQALNFSDSIGGRVAHVLVDDLVNFSDSIGVVIRPPTATAHAVALAPEVKVTASLETVVIPGKRSIRFGFDAEKAMWVMFAIGLGDLYDLLTGWGLSPADAIFIVAAVGGYVVAYLSAD